MCASDNEEVKWCRVKVSASDNQVVRILVQIKLEGFGFGKKKILKSYTDNL